MTLGPFGRALTQLFVVVVVLIALMATRTVLESRAAWAAAEVALAAGDVDRAIDRLRDTARWDAPLNPYAVSALARLDELGQRAEQTGDRARALAAYRAIHGAIMATRSFYTPHAAELARADERIATLMAAEPQAALDRGRTPEERKAAYLALLVPRDPRPLGVLLAFIGLFTWVGSAVAFVTWGVDAEGRFLRRFARRSVICLLVGWIAFAVGLRIA